MPQYHFHKHSCTLIPPLTLIIQHEIIIDVNSDVQKICSSTFARNLLQSNNYLGFLSLIQSRHAPPFHWIPLSWLRSSFASFFSPLDELSQQKERITLDALHKMPHSRSAWRGHRTVLKNSLSWWPATNRKSLMRKVFLGPFISLILSPSWGLLVSGLFLGVWEWPGGPTKRALHAISS